MLERIRNWLTVDRIVDLVMDAILLFWEVITSPLLIVMRLVRWALGEYIIGGLKNKIKQLIYWLQKKPWWVSVIVAPIAVTILFYTLVAIWLGSELLNPEWWFEGDNNGI
jgi:hypothetical protein